MRGQFVPDYLAVLHHKADALTAAAGYLLAGDGNRGDEHCQQQGHLDLFQSSDLPQFTNFVAPKDWNLKHRPCNRIMPHQN
jgi:hypothetical protein